VPRPQRGWRRKRYALVHVRPDGSRRVVAEIFTRWVAALRRAEDVALALQCEAERGNPDAAGVVDVVNMDDGAVMQRVSIGDAHSAGQ
jgi:hypothetical protein